MTPSSLTLSAAERLIRRACRRLPGPDRDERYREWTAELPAILHDPDTRQAPRRALRALLYAADQHRSIRRIYPASTRRARIAARYRDGFLDLMRNAALNSTRATITLIILSTGGAIGALLSIGGIFIAINCVDAFIVLSHFESGLSIVMRVGHDVTVIRGGGGIDFARSSVSVDARAFFGGALLFGTLIIVLGVLLAGIAFKGVRTLSGIRRTMEYGRNDRVRSS